MNCLFYQFELQINYNVTVITVNQSKNLEKIILQLKFNVKQINS